MRGYDLLFAVAALAGMLKLWEENEIHAWHFPSLLVAYFVGRYLWKQTGRLDIPDQPTPPDASAHAPAYAPAHTEGHASASQSAAGWWILAGIAVALAGVSFFHAIQELRAHIGQTTHYAPAPIPPPPPGFEIER